MIGGRRLSNVFLRQASGADSTAVATLTCEEEVKVFDSAVEETGEVVKVAVVSDEGNLFLYRLPLSTLPSTPVTHSYSIQYISSPPKVRVSVATKMVSIVTCCICMQPSTPSPLPVLAVVFAAHMISVAHSSYIAPTIESIVSAASISP